jgi:N4-gp56 family major capsid protein
MAVQVTTQASLSAEMKTFYDRVLLQRAVPQLVYAASAQRRPLSRRSGRTIEFRKFSSLSRAVAALTEGVTPAGNSLNVTSTTATINQYGDYVEGSDILELTAIDPILTETAQLLGEQAGASLNQLVRDVIFAGTSVQYANGRTSRLTVAAGDNLTVLEIRRAVRTLKKNNIRPVAGQDYVAYVTPSGVFDLQGDPKWEAAAQYAGAGQIFSGEIGRLFGVRFIESTENPVYVGAGAGTPAIDVHASLVVGADAFGLIPLEGADLEFIFKALGASGTADPLNQRWTSGWKTSFTSKILNDLAAVRIEHAVSG